jgi:hypothetical protein
MKNNYNGNICTTSIFSQEPRSWVCAECGRKYENRMNFKRHLQKGHTESLAQVWGKALILSKV